MDFSSPLRCLTWEIFFHTVVEHSFFYWIVGFLCFSGEKCAWLSKLSSSIPFFPKSFFMGSMRIPFYEMVDIFCLWVEQNVFSYQSSLSFFLFFFYCENLFLYGRRGFSPLGWHFVFERRKMYLVHLPSLRIFFYIIDRNSLN